MKKLKPKYTFYTKFPKTAGVGGGGGICATFSFKSIKNFLNKLFMTV